MTRAEEIRQAAEDYSVKEALTDNVCYEALEGFKAGVEWADTSMLKKACKWLKENADKYIEIKDGALQIKRSLYMTFRKVMAE